MASRMERYYTQPKKKVTKRTELNKELYYNIYEDSNSYSNIEGIASLDNVNEIDIAKLKNMLKNRENYKTSKELRSIMREEPVVKKEVIEEDNSDIYDERSYDISDIISKAKNNHQSDAYHSLNESNYDILKSLQVKGKKHKEKVEPMEQTLADTKLLKELNDSDLSYDLLGDLKSNNTATFVNGKDAIRQLLEEAKADEKKRKEREKKVELDKTFFTSSMSFDKSDFEDGSFIPKGNDKIIKNVLLVLLLIMIACGVIAFVLYLIS